jgi:hypothetical protein
MRPKALSKCCKGTARSPCSRYRADLEGLNSAPARTRTTRRRRRRRGRRRGALNPRQLLAIELIGHRITGARLAHAAVRRRMVAHRTMVHLRSPHRRAGRRRCSRGRCRGRRLRTRPAARLRSAHRRRGRRLCVCQSGDGDHQSRGDRGAIQEMLHASILCGNLGLDHYAATARCARGTRLRASGRKQPFRCFVPADTQPLVSRIRPRHRAII